MADSKAQNTEVWDQLFVAELQFRLAVSVELATQVKRQTLDVPETWVHGKHKITYKEIALRQDQADYAAWHLLNSATFLMATEIKNSIIKTIPEPLNCKNGLILSAFQISRFIRNAFTHHPFKPIWSIEKKYQDEIFAVGDIIELNTKGLHGRIFKWQDYGGHLQY